MILIKFFFLFFCTVVDNMESIIYFTVIMLNTDYTTI